MAPWINGVKLLILTTVGILLFSSGEHAQEWRAVKPIESTCKDVERLLGIKACGKSEVAYKLPTGGTVYIGFAKVACEDVWPGRYNVSPGTVTSVQAHLGNAGLFLSDLNLDESKLRKGDAGDMLGVIVYESKELGVKLEVSEERQVISATYFPSTKYDHLRCPPPTQSCKKTSLIR